MAKIACAPATPPPAPAMEVNKNVSLYNGNPQAAAVGDVISYTIEVCNTGNVPLVNITVSDPGADSITNGTIASLAPNACATATARHTVTQADLDAGGVTNTATATGQDPNGAAVTASGSVTRSLDPEEPSFTIVKQLAAGVTTPLTVGQIVAYEFVVTNTGDVPLTGVTLTDPQITPISGSPIATLATGASQTITGSTILTAAMVTGANGAREFTNTVAGSATSPSGANVTANDSNTAAVNDVINFYRINPDPTNQPHACELVLNNPQRLGYADGYHYMIDDNGTISLYNYATRTIAANPTWATFGGGGPLNGMTPAQALASNRWIDVEDGWLTGIDPVTDAMVIYLWSTGASGGTWGVTTPLSGGPLAGQTVFNAINTPPAGYTFLGLIGNHMVWLNPAGCLVSYNEFNRIFDTSYTTCNLSGGGFGGPLATAVNGGRFIGVTDGWLLFIDAANNLQWYNAANGLFAGQVLTQPLLPACQCWTCTNGTCVRTDTTAPNQPETAISTQTGSEQIPASC